MKILLADDHELIRDALKTLIPGSANEPIEYIEACNYDEAWRLLDFHRDTDIAIIDLRMPGISDERRIEAFGREYPNVALIILSGFLQGEMIANLQKIPAVYGVVSKNGSLDTLRFVIQRVMDGHRMGDAHQVYPAIGVSDAPDDAAFSLPPRLQEIYALLRAGKSNKAIAWDLQLSEGTVKNYVSSIYRQLNVHNRIQAAWKESAIL